jgi:hypothetical protein
MEEKNQDDDEKRAFAASLPRAVRVFLGRCSTLFRVSRLLSVTWSWGRAPAGIILCRKIVANDLLPHAGMPSAVL